MKRLTEHVVMSDHGEIMWQEGGALYFRDLKVKRELAAALERERERYQYCLQGSVDLSRIIEEQRATIRDREIDVTRERERAERLEEALGEVPTFLEGADGG